MEQLFRIGEVARLFNISQETLRHYEKLGILIPEHVEKNSGFRYYSTRQFEVINTIKYLRALDMPLDEIAGFLKNRDVGVIREKLEKHREMISEKKHELEIIEKKIGNRLKMLDSALSSRLDRIEQESAEPIRMVRMRDALRIKSYLDLEKPIRALEPTGKKTAVFLGKVGVGISPEHLTENEFSVYDYVFLILEDEEDFPGQTVKLPAHRCISVRFRGSHERAPEQYRRLNEYMAEHSLEPTSHSREITLIDEGLTSDREKFVTEIKIPVRKKQ